MTTHKETTSLNSGALSHTFSWVGCAVIISLLVAAVVMPSWPTFGIALPLGIAYVLLVTMPVFLAVVSGREKI